MSRTRPVNVSSKALKPLPVVSIVITPPEGAVKAYQTPLEKLLTHEGAGSPADVAPRVDCTLVEGAPESTMGPRRTGHWPAAHLEGMTIIALSITNCVPEYR